MFGYFLPVTCKVLYMHGPLVPLLVPILCSKSTMAKTAGDKRNAKAKVILRTDHTTTKDAGENSFLRSLNNTTMLDGSHHAPPPSTRV